MSHQAQRGEGVECLGDTECGTGLMCEMGYCVPFAGKKHYSKSSHPSTSVSERVSVVLTVCMVSVTYCTYSPLFASKQHQYPAGRLNRGADERDPVASTSPSATKVNNPNYSSIGGTQVYKKVPLTPLQDPTHHFWQQWMNLNGFPLKPAGYIGTVCLRCEAGELRGQIPPQKLLQLIPMMYSRMQMSHRLTKTPRYS